MYLSLMPEVLDCRLEVREFKIQSRNYIHFWINLLDKNRTPLFIARLAKA